MMCELNLDSVAESNQDTSRLLAEFKGLKDQRARVFRTFCTYLKQDYVLVTTSKDICLALGSLSEWGRNYLCHLIEAMFVGEEDMTEMLFSVSLDDEDARKDKLFVTRAVDRDDKIIFHLSPAR